jgi:hypothetical protein
VNEAEWLRGTDPVRMINFCPDDIDECKRYTTHTARKLRLLGIEILKRRGAPINSEDFQQLYDLVDEVITPFGPGKLSVQGYLLSRSLPQRWALDQVAAAQNANHPRAEEMSNLARDILGNPFREIVFNPVWLLWNDRAIERMARWIYCNFSWDHVPRLGDALMDAGALEDNLLVKHLHGFEPCLVCQGRGSIVKEWSRFAVDCLDCAGSGWMPMRGQHCRGCWPLDLLLGKE